MSILSKFFLTIFITLVGSIVAMVVKQETGFGFFLTTAAIGILLIFIWIKPRNKLKDYKTCPYCAESIKEEAILCKHCGKDLTVDALSKNFQDIRAKEQLKKLGITYINRIGANDLTPLMEYAEKGDLEIVKLLLEAKADKFLSNMSGFSAEYMARRAGYEEIAKYIHDYRPV